MCEHCSPEHSDCSVCRDWDRRRNYSRAVSAIMLGVLVVVFVTAVVCGIVNVVSKH